MFQEKEINMFVYGGTPDTQSNRMLEDAASLQPVHNLDLYTAFKAAIASQSLESIQRMLRYASNCDANIVGSRGYVYNSAKLLEAISTPHFNELSRFYDLSLLPRTGGLRAAVREAIA